MKKIFTLLSIFVLAISIFPSCKKQEVGITTTKNIYATIKTGETYQYTIETVSTNQSVKISKQASYFSISETEIIATTFGPSPILYNYIPATGFVGADEVQITVADEENDGDEEQSNGNCGGQNNSNNIGHQDNDNGKEFGRHHGKRRHHNSDDAVNKTIYIFHINVVRGSSVR